MHYYNIYTYVLIIILYDSQIEYTIQKNSVKMSGKKDGCKQLDNIKPSSDIEKGLDLLGLPKCCPINKVCCRFGHNFNKLYCLAILN